MPTAKNTTLSFFGRCGRKNPSDPTKPLIGYIARNTDGSIRFMNQADAINYCAIRGQHLPSARALAQIASRACTADIRDREPCGAAGISETAKNGCYYVSAKNADGKIDNFYFSYAGYNHPVDDLGNNWFWSDSTRALVAD